MALKEYFVRKKFLIQKSMQLKYVMFVMLTVLAISILVFLTIHLSVWLVLMQKGISAEAKIVVDEILHNMNVLFMFEIPIVLLIAGFAGIMLSHKVAGPV